MMEFVGDFLFLLLLSPSTLPDTSGVVFDTRSKMVMSQGGTTERMKEKVGRLDGSKEPAGLSAAVAPETAALRITITP